MKKKRPFRQAKEKGMKTKNIPNLATSRTGSRVTHLRLVVVDPDKLLELGRLGGRNWSRLKKRTEKENRNTEAA